MKKPDPRKKGFVDPTDPDAQPRPPRAQTLRAIGRYGIKTSLIETGWDEQKGEWAPDSPVARFIAAVRMGNFLGPAAEWAGINEWTMRRWMAIAREHMPDEYKPEDRKKVPPEKRPYTDMLYRLSTAEATGEVELVTLWRAAAKDNWKAAMNLLARRHQPRWGLRTEMAMTGPGGGPISLVAASAGDVARAIAMNPEARQLASQLLASIAPAAPPLEQPEDGEDDDDEEIDDGD